ncbi:MAG: cytochrome P450 [Ilumatobacteraceae bacterium]
MNRVDQEQTMREPYVFPLSESPFSPDVPPLERRQRVLAVGADVVTDELGLVVDFMSETDVDAVLNDPRFAAVGMPTLALSGVHDGPLFDLWTALMFTKDAAEHHRIRAVVARDFAPKVVEEHRSDVQRIASALCDRLEGVDTTDLSRSFAVPLAARTACRVVGIPERDADRAAVWAFDLVRAFFPFMSAERRDRAQRAAVEFSAYVDDLLAEKRRTPTDDIATRLASDEVADVLSYEEARALTMNLVFGGLEATAKSIATGVYNLLTHDKFAELAQHGDRIPAAVLELLRFAPPAQSVARLAPVDLVCQDVALRGGQVASANLVAACRDPKRHLNPDTLDFDRESSKQLAFGAGTHYCLGANLAKLALAVAFESLLDRFPSMSIDSGAGGDVVWDYEGFAGVIALPVRLRP